MSGCCSDFIWMSWVYRASISRERFFWKVSLLILCSVHASSSFEKVSEFTDAKFQRGLFWANFWFWLRTSRFVLRRAISSTKNGKLQRANNSENRIRMAGWVRTFPIILRITNQQNGQQTNSPNFLLFPLKSKHEEVFLKLSWCPIFIFRQQSLNGTTMFKTFFHQTVKRYAPLVSGQTGKRVMLGAYSQKGSSDLENLLWMGPLKIRLKQNRLLAH